MHGREGEERKRRRHMWPVPAPGTAASAAAAALSPPPLALPAAASENLSSESDSSRSSCDSFLKDGRKIRVGDCALFQAGNAPPFIGIIRWFTAGKADYLTLCVNWLYRPADIKLAKGVLVEAAPNEVFYSFHKDVISAASLLHPCKVAFLQKGVELPAGISSFVCRRVYDITNKRLWWLTDQDYINGRQEEVDHLLDKTRLEMHTAIQSGGRSPKPLNGPTSSQQLKSGSENVHNSGSSLLSQTKGKKRDRSDQVIEPFKRERSARPDDGDSIGFKSENLIKAEIVKITEKGALVSTEGVEKLLNLMQLDKTEKKVDVADQVLLADVIAATDRYDCLGLFVQLRGVPILDDWLQEVHKCKTSDSSSPKESDKAAEELILALLRALAKLPVNLNALQTCNIGKSVNHLRSHKNPEIQKKARSLIDTWKKRVDAEMTKINDTKSVTSSQPVWQVKPGSSDVSHAGNRCPGSIELAAKSPINQSTSCKSHPSKSGHSDAIVKSALVTQGSSKMGSTLATSVTVASKDPLCKASANIGGAEMLPTAVKEEKSSSSSQSQNSQSCSSDHVKAVGSSWKEDTRSSSVGSINATKAAGGSSRHRRSNNGVLGTSISGVHKETHLGKSGSLNRVTTLEKSTKSGLTCEKPIDMSVADHGNNHRLIVRLSNPVRSPARSVSGGSFEDPSISGSRASSPGVPDKHEHSDRRVKLRGDGYRSNIATDTNTESWQSNDVKEPLVGAGGVRLLEATLDEEHMRSTEDIGKATEAPGAACSSSGNEQGVFLTEPRTISSFSSINALIESCVKYSEASAPLVVEDDMGMNLLATVAAGEISKSDLISPTGSPGDSPATEDPSTEAKSRLLSDDDATHSHVESDEAADADSNKEDKKFTGEQVGQSPTSAMSSHKIGDSCCTKSELKLEEEKDVCSLVSKPSEVEKQDDDGASLVEQKPIMGGQVLDHYTNCNLKEGRSLADECKPSTECAIQKIGDGSICTSGIPCKDKCDLDIAASCIKSEKLVAEESQSCPAAKEVPMVATSSDQQQPLTTESVDRSGDVIPSAASDVPYPKNADDSRTCKPDKLGISCVKLNDKQEHDSLNPSNLDELVRPAITFSGIARVIEDLKMEVRECSYVGSTNQEPSSSCTAQESEHQAQPAGSRLASQEPPSSCTAQASEHQGQPSGSRLSGPDADVREDLASSAEASSLAVTVEPDGASKVDFDLNEGIPGDDGNQGETAVSVAPVCSSTIHLPSLSPFANPMSNSLPAPITVAAPAKGPFVPPEILLKSKGEPGWKGSAATSAFRPAEPRKVVEMPPSDSAGKQCRALLDIDLNEPDERVVEDMVTQSSAKSTGSKMGAVSNNVDACPRISGGLDLDLNRVDEGTENGLFLASAAHRLEVPLLAAGPASGEFPNGEANMLRDFDLNNGPDLDDACAEPVTRSQNTKSTSSVQFLPPVAGIRMNTAELGGVSPWFPPGSSHPAVSLPSFLTNRGEQPYPIVAAPGAQRILGPATASGPFGGDIYRGPVLSSSPAMAFPPATALTCAGFAFGSNFPLASTSLSGGSATFMDSSSGAASGFPVIPSPLFGPAGAILSSHPRPYMMSLPESSSSGGSDNARKWITPGLDLNAGPGHIDMEGKDERLPLASRQLLFATSQASTEEQVRMYAVPGAGLKRKEPEGGWDADRSAYKQLSWQ